MINAIITNKATANVFISEYVYSVSNLVFHFIEIYNIVFIADAIGKEVIADWRFIGIAELIFFFINFSYRKCNIFYLDVRILVWTWLRNKV